MAENQQNYIQQQYEGALVENEEIRNAMEQMEMIKKDGDQHLKELGDSHKKIEENLNIAIDKNVYYEDQLQ